MKFLSVLSVLCGLMSSAQALDRTAFTFTKYDLNVRVEPEQRRLAVRGTITLRNDSSVPQKDLSLQISSSLDWRSISAAGKPVEFVSQPYTSDIDHTGTLSEALVSLPQAVQPKAAIELEIGYEGVMLLEGTRLTRIGVPEDAAKNTDWDQIGQSFSAVRGIGHVVWYPVATEAASLSQENAVAESIGRWTQREAATEMRVELCVWGNAGDSQTALMNDPADDKATGETAPGSAAADCREHVFTPLGQAVPLFVVGRYEALAQEGAMISYLPGHRDQAQSYLRSSDTVLPFVTSWFGRPRHHARFVEVPGETAAPYENNGVLLTPLTETDAKLVQIAAVHQFTHAAFLSPRPWIYEGLAHFAQALYREQQSNRETALHFMGDQLPAVAETEKTALAEPGNPSPEQSLVNTALEELYRSKAMYVWWMLRDMLGAPALKQALAAYQPDQDIDVSYLQHLLEAQSKRELTWFFDDWVYHDRGLPDFRIASVYPSPASQGGYLVTVTVENLGEAGAEVPVTLRSANDAETERLVVRGKSKTSIRFVVRALPSEAVVNDGSVPESDMRNNTFTVVLKQP